MLRSTQTKSTKIETRCARSSSSASLNSDFGFTLKLVEFRVVLYPDTGRAKEIESEVEVHEEGSLVRRHVIRVNSPLKHNGLKLHQSACDTQGQTWSLLSVRRDPGAPIAFAGFVLLGIGLLCRLYVAPERRRDGSV